MTRFEMNSVNANYNVVQLVVLFPYQVLFPDVCKLISTPVSGELPGRLKSAPQGSLSRQLASTLSIVNTECGMCVYGVCSDVMVM
jgi:hypothetical protein